MERDTWLETNDPGYVVYVPAFMDQDITVLEADDTPALDFNLTNTLKDEVMVEVRQVIAENGLELAHPERCAVTFREV